MLDVDIDHVAHGTGFGVALWHPPSPLPAASAAAAEGGEDADARDGAPSSPYVIMVRRAIPGERVRVQIRRKKRNYAEAAVLERVGDQPSPHAVTPRCRHFSEGCGGCKFQNLAYERQLEEKEAQVRHLYRQLFAALHRDIGGGDDEAADEVVRPSIGARQQYGYRNKMDFSFGTRKWYPNPADKPPAAAQVAPDGNGREMALGLHAPGRFDKILPIENCDLQPAFANEMLRFVERRCRHEAHLLPAYDVFTCRGLMRNLVIRSASPDGDATEYMLNFITSPLERERGAAAALQRLADDLYAAFGGASRHRLVCVVHNCTSSKSGVVSPEERAQQRLLAGARDHLEQRLLGDTRFRISANSFFQTNPLQTQVLYRQVLEASGLAQPRASERTDELAARGALVLDLFCGTGSIALCLAPYARRVLGVEVVESAVRDARANAARNGISNAEFHVADLESGDAAQRAVLGEALECWRGDGERASAPDVLVLDPPRAGLHPRLVRAIARAPAERRPRRIVYVSCNAATQTRDLALLAAEAPWYRIWSAQCVDMFPHTPHIETVTLLKLVE